MNPEPGATTQTKTKSGTNTKLAVATAFLGFAAVAAAAAGTSTSGTPCLVDSFAEPTVVEVYVDATTPTVLKLCKGERVVVYTEGKNTDADFGVRDFSKENFLLQKVGSGVVAPVKVLFETNESQEFELQAPGIVYTGLFRGMNKKTGEAYFYMSAADTVPDVVPELQIVSHYIGNNELVKGEDILVGSYILNSSGTEEVCMTDFTVGLQGTIGIETSIEKLTVKVTGEEEIPSITPQAKNNVIADVCLEPEETKTLSLFADLASLSGPAALQTTIDAFTYVGQESSEIVTDEEQVVGTVFTYSGISDIDESFWADMSVSNLQLDTGTLVNGDQTVGKYALSSTGMSDVCVNEISATLSGNVNIGELMLVADSGEVLSTIYGPEELGTFDAVFPVEFCMDPKTTKGLEIQTLVTGVTQSFNYYLTTTFDSVTFENMGSAEQQAKTFDLAPQLLVNN